MNWKIIIYNTSYRNAMWSTGRGACKSLYYYGWKVIRTKRMTCPKSEQLLRNNIGTSLKKVNWIQISQRFGDRWNRWWRLIWRYRDEIKQTSCLIFDVYILTTSVYTNVSFETVHAYLYLYKTYLLMDRQYYDKYFTYSYSCQIEQSW